MAAALKFEGAVSTVQEDADNYDETAWRGFDQLLEKEYFVEEARMMVQPMGEQFGEELARFEQGRVLRSLLEAEIAVVHLDDADDPLRILSSELAKLDSSLEKCAVLLFGAWSLYRSLEMNDVLEDRDRDGSERPDAYVGRFKGAAVYRLHSRGHDGALVGNLSDLGTWQQFEPYPVEDDHEELLGQFVRFSLATVDQGQAEAIIAAAQEGGEEESDYTVQELIDEKLHLLCGTRVEWYTRDDSSAMWIQSEER